MLVTVIGLLAITTNAIHGVVGVSETSIEDAPYQVSVRYLDDHICSGIIVSPRVVFPGEPSFGLVTNASQYSIQYGVYALGSKENVIIVKRILKYNADMDEVALMFLESDIPFSTIAQPIVLTSVAPAIGTYANVTGWGAFSDNHLILHRSSVKIVDISVCQGKFLKRITINENMLCAGITDDVNAVEFDYGSPLVSSGILFGSFLRGADSDGDSYSIYTNVAAYTHWVYTNINL